MVNNVTVLQACRWRGGGVIEKGAGAGKVNAMCLSQ